MSFQSRTPVPIDAHFLATAGAPLPTRRQRLTKLWKVWRERVQARRLLAGMDARSLRDAGISPAAAAYESGKPFWQAMGGLR